VKTEAVEYISTDAGTFSSFSMEIPPMETPPGFAVHLSAAIKEVTDLTVIAFGRINGAMQAERTLAGGKADFIGMAWGLLCEPEFVNKAREGGSLRYGDPEDRDEAPVGRRDRRGLSGLKVAALCGHWESLYEENDRFGGQLNIAVRIPLRSEVLNVMRYLATQVKKLGEETHLSERMAADKIAAMESDAVVIATGSLRDTRLLAGQRRHGVGRASAKGARRGQGPRLRRHEALAGPGQDRVPGGEGEESACRDARLFPRRADTSRQRRFSLQEDPRQHRDRDHIKRGGEKNRGRRRDD
jgi:hypothetical protein